MISKSPKEIYQATYSKLKAEGLDVSEETIKKFNVFLFGKINSMLMSLEHLELYVPKLGTWKFRRKKGEAFYAEIANRSVDKALLGGGFSEEVAQGAQEKYEARRERMRRLIESHEKMIVDKRAFKQKRNGSSTNKEHISEQEEDLGGVNKQSVPEGTY